jgi:hypothetical protein
MVTASKMPEGSLHSCKPPICEDHHSSSSQVLREFFKSLAGRCVLNDQDYYCPYPLMGFGFVEADALA